MDIIGGGMMMKRGIRFVIPLLAVLLSGCSQFRKYPPTMGADPPLTGGEGIALVNELQSAFEIIPVTTDETASLGTRPCDYTLPQHQESQSRSYSRYARDGKLPHQFNCIRYKTSTTAEAAAHMQAGFALTDLYCDIYFRRIAEHSNQRRFGRGVVNDVGAAVTAVLGLTNVVSPVVGGVGAGFGLLDSSFRNYEDAFLVSADLSTLQTKVYAEQSKFREAASKSTDLTRYSQANSMILKYANYCSYTGMRGLINASLTQTTEDIPTAMKRMTEYITGAIAAAKAIKASNAAEGAVANDIDLASNSTDGD